MAEPPRDRLVDRSPETTALRGNVNEWNRRGIEASVLIHGGHGIERAGKLDHVSRSSAEDRGGGPRSAAHGFRGTGWRFRGSPLLLLRSRQALCRCGWHPRTPAVWGATAPAGPPTEG